MEFSIEIFGDNLLPKIAHLVGNLVDFEKYVRNHQDTLLISKVFQSKSQYTEARNILNKFYNFHLND